MFGTEPIDDSKGCTRTRVVDSLEADSQPTAKNHRRILSQSKRFTIHVVKRRTRSLHLDVLRPGFSRAADFVILCGTGQGEVLRQRLTRWLAARGLKLNEEKTRLADSRKGFDFLGFRLRWQPSRVTGKWYVHAEASPRSQQRLREAVRAKLNHWTLGQRIPEAVAGINRLLRGWSGYFHYRHSSRVMARLNWQVRDRLKRWLWRKRAKKPALWSNYPDERLQTYGLWSLPDTSAWKSP